MSIPQNFSVVEQRILPVNSFGQSVQFTNVNAAACPDLWVKNTDTGSVKCQIALGAGTTAPTAVQEASANGTAQMEIAAGESCVLKKGAATFVSSITEAGTATKLYLFIGFGA